MKPQGITDAVAIPLARDSYTIANVAFAFHETARPLTEGQFDELRLLARHLRRAVVISRLLDSTAKAVCNFAEALDASRAGVVLVDRRRGIVHANRVALAMLEAGDPIQEAGGQLELPGAINPRAFADAIELTKDAGIGGNGAGIPARRGDGRPLTVQVLPLERRQGPRTPGEAVAAVFISDAPDGPAAPAKILSALFDLTPAEARWAAVGQTVMRFRFNIHRSGDAPSR